MKINKRFYLELSNEDVNVPTCPLVESLKIKNNKLTDQEISEGFFIDIVLGKCNIKKALAEKSNAIRREYEAFNNMHDSDGIVDTPDIPSKL